MYLFDTLHVVNHFSRLTVNFAPFQIIDWTQFSLKSFIRDILRPLFFQSHLHMCVYTCLIIFALITHFES